jgi:hypothetical protein
MNNDIILKITACIYNLILLIGTMYVVIAYDRSLWLFVLTYMFMVNSKTSKLNVNS